MAQKGCYEYMVCIDEHSAQITETGRGFKVNDFDRRERSIIDHSAPELCWMIFSTNLTDNRSVPVRNTDEKYLLIKSPIFLYVTTIAWTPECVQLPSIVYIVH